MEEYARSLTGAMDYPDITYASAHATMPATPALVLDGQMLDNSGVSSKLGLSTTF